MLSQKQADSDNKNTGACIIKKDKGTIRKIQVNLAISKSKGMAKILRVIRSST